MINPVGSASYVNRAQQVSPQAQQSHTQPPPKQPSGTPQDTVELSSAAKAGGGSKEQVNPFGS